MAPTTATIPICLRPTPRLNADSIPVGQWRPGNAGEDLVGVARRRPCWDSADKMAILSTPAKLAVGFGRGACPARPTHGCEIHDVSGGLHPKAHYGADGGSSAPVKKLNSRGPPTGFGEAAHEHTRLGYVFLLA